MKSDSPTRQLLKEVLWAVSLTVVCAWVMYLVFKSVNYHWHWDTVWKWRWLILKGWGLTMFISACALFLSVPLALLLMAGQRSGWIPVRQFSRACVEIVRGSPLLVLLLLGYYGVANALGVTTPTPAGVVILALFHASYLSEIFRGAWESIGASQLEAARAVGFSRGQTWRFVIFPQALRRALPGTAGQMVSLIKDSSLLTIIGVEELTQMVRAANAQAYT
ncbi:MAG: amino acid ABC transporter permease, partial [Verrucomicrobium sp.]